MAMTTFLKNELLKQQFRGVSYTAPNVMYIALSKSAPNDLGTNCNEPTANSYERLAVATNSTNWTDATDGTISNSVSFRFNEAEESWTTSAAPITHWAIYDSATSGNMLFYGALTRAQEIPRGAVLEIPENGLVTTIVNQ